MQSRHLRPVPCLRSRRKLAPTDVMRAVLIVCLVLLAAGCWSSPVPGDSSMMELLRARREPQFIKGQKGNRAPDPTNLRKGEYICGNKICSLRPGQIPKNCNGVCQYKV